MRGSVIRLALALAVVPVVGSAAVPAANASTTVAGSDAASTAGGLSDFGDQPGPGRPDGARIVVAQDGTGDVTTVQAAIDAVPAGNTTPVTIWIRPGVYRELVTLPADKPYISLIGAGHRASDVVITYDNANGTPKPDGSGTYGTSGSATFLAAANDFTARNVTFENAFDEAAHPEFTGHQAVALRTLGDRQVYANDRFLGNQDTLYANSPSTTSVARQYFVHCYIEGDVDFIFGRATAVFDHTLINALDKGSTTLNGYVTAASTPGTQQYGFLITHSLIVRTAAAGTFYLGRPWHPGGDVTASPQVVIRDTILPAAINSTPWTDMSGFSWRDARFAEYHNVGLGAADPATLPSDDRPQLTDAQAADATVRTYLAGSDGWNPA